MEPFCRLIRVLTKRYKVTAFASTQRSPAIDYFLSQQTIKRGFMRNYSLSRINQVRTKQATHYGVLEIVCREIPAG